MGTFYFKIAWRSLWKNKVFSFINLTGLALSMTCCLAIGMFIWDQLHYDHFHSNLNSIYRITEKQDQAGTMYNVAVTPGPLAPALKKDFPEVKETLRLGSWSGLLKSGTQAFQETKILVAENSLFTMFNFPFVKGDMRMALQSPGDIVITEATAEKYYGKDWRNNDAMIGQTFTLNNETSFKLAGVVQNLPANSSIQFDILLPITWLFNSDKWSNSWGSNNYHTYVQLTAGTNANAFAKKIEKQLPVYNSKTTDLMYLQPLKAQYLHSKFDFSTDWGKRSDIKYVKIFSGVGLLLLVIACVNFINLSTARAVKRSMEVGIRKVNGATRKHLMQQFLGESVLLTLLAGLAAVLLLYCVQPFLAALTGVSIAIDFASPLFLFFFVGLIIIVGVIAGLYPAFVLSRYKPVRVFRKSTGRRGSNFIQQGLVVFQFSISIILIVTTIFMYRQLQFMQEKDLGFDTSQLINLRLNGPLKEKSSLLKVDLQNSSAISATAPATMSLVNVENSSYLEWDGMQEKDKFLVTHANVDPDFIPALGIQLMNGSNFSWQKSNDTSTFILNEAAVKRMGFTVTTAIGKKVNFWGAQGRVIGVVKDFHFKSLSSGIDPFILRYQPQDRYFNMFVKTAPGKTAEAIGYIQKLYRQYDSDSPAEFSFVNEAINKLYEDDQRTAGVIFLFACLTIFVGCLGLFGLTVFAAEQRVKEVGIRKVLGAGVLSITELLSKDFLKLVLVAIVIAVPVAWYASIRWLQAFAYRVDVDWWVFIFAAVAALVLALTTISFHAVKAASANPVKSLRSE